MSDMPDVIYAGRAKGRLLCFEADFSHETKYIRADLAQHTATDEAKAECVCHQKSYEKMPEQPKTALEAFDNLVRFCRHVHMYSNCIIEEEFSDFEDEIRAALQPDPAKEKMRLALSEAICLIEYASANSAVIDKDKNADNLARWKLALSETPATNVGE